MGNERPKGYNNDSDWQKIEAKNTKTTVIDIEADALNTYSKFDDAEIIDDELFPTESVEDNRTEILELDFGAKTPPVQEKENFSDVLALTQFDESMATSGGGGGNYVVAEYKKIETATVSKKHEIEAKKFVNRITKFILEFSDIALTEAHTNYLKDVASFQLQHLTDLLYLVDVNRQMLDNIIARVNATMADDYAIINSYNMLANQHLKFIKELQNSYRSIPSIIKKMRTEVVCDQDLGIKQPGADEPMSEAFGETHFNNGKQLLKTLAEQYNANNTESQDDDEE